MTKRKSLSLAELRHLFHVVDADRANGGYYGTRGDYELRAERLLAWIQREIVEKERTDGE